MQEGSVLSFLKGLLFAAFIFLEINVNIFIILVVFMIVDTITGTIKVLRVDKKQFNFKRLLWGLASKFLLLIIPLLVALLLKGIGDPTVGTGPGQKGIILGVDLIMRILIFTEFISAIGNIYTIKTKKPVKEIDIFTMLFTFIRCKAVKMLNAYSGQDIELEECKKKQQAPKQEPEKEPKEE